MKDYRNDELCRIEIRRTYTRTDIGYTSGHGVRLMRFSLVASMSAFLLVPAFALTARVPAQTVQTQLKKAVIKQKSTGNKPSERAQTSVEVINGSTRFVSEFREGQPRQAEQGLNQGEPAETRVEEINGLTRSTKVFHEEPRSKSSASGNARGAGRQTEQAALAGSSVEVINGAHWSTRTFGENAGEANEPGTPLHKPHPVVIGVATSRTQGRVGSRGGNTHPVVVGVSSESENRNSGPVVVGVAANGVASDRPVQGTVTKRISKRRPYVRNPVNR
ncbi:MAG TPA: hypothetical protein VMU48_20775 [Terracidiphilus sp.]|nr:hypothetical protein [Terracidiphilus sp.]